METSQEGCSKGSCCACHCGMKVVLGLLLLLIGGIGGYWFGRCGAQRSMVCPVSMGQNAPAATSPPATQAK